MLLSGLLDQQSVRLNENQRNVLAARDPACRTPQKIQARSMITSSRVMSMACRAAVFWRLSPEGLAAMDTAGRIPQGPANAPDLLQGNTRGIPLIDLVKQSVECGMLASNSSICQLSLPQLWCCMCCIHFCLSCLLGSSDNIRRELDSKDSVAVSAHPRALVSNHAAST